MSSELVQTSLLFIVFVTFKFLSFFDFKVGGKILSGVLGAGVLTDFFTICNITFVFFTSFFPLSIFDPPESDVVLALILRGRTGSVEGLSLGLTVGLRSISRLVFTLVGASVAGVQK